MNTIPTTSKRVRVPYTVVGGKSFQGSRTSFSHASIVLLNRGGRVYRTESFKELERLGFREVISIEGPSRSYDVEALSQQFPSVRFLLLHGDTSRGEQVNVGLEESRGRLVFVLWNDMRVPAGTFSSRLVERVAEQDWLCTVPALRNARGAIIPSLQAPAFYRRHLLRVLPFQPQKDGAPTLFPFDYCGIYSRERFSLAGGFDPSFANPYWQLMDFGFRCHMWGEHIGCNTALKLAYAGEVPTMDTTPDDSYPLFYLKNLAVRYNGEAGVLPVSSLVSLVLRGSGLGRSVSLFKAAREWVRVNRYRFTQDARDVTDLWEVPEQ